MNNKTLIALEFIASFIMNIPILFAQWFVQRGTHKEMMIKHSESRWGIFVNSYLNFKKAFESVEWKCDPHFPTSLFGTGEYGYNQFHASIIVIRGKGYILTPLGLMLANRLKRKKINELRLGVKNGLVKWAA